MLAVFVYYLITIPTSCTNFYKGSWN